MRRTALPLALTLLSLLLWAFAAGQQSCHPYRDLSCGGYTDHFSHMNTARLFTEVGPAIWRQPLRDHGNPLTEAQIQALPADIRVASPPDMRTFPGWPEGKPFLSSWNAAPRFHPPGDMVLTAPVALLYSFTDLTFAGANRLLVLLFLLYAHIPVLLLLRQALGDPPASPVGVLAGALVYAEVVHWALEGFYEGLLVAPLLLSARALHRGDGLTGLLWFSAAASLHFRAYFFAPWAVYAVVLLLRRRPPSYGRRELLLAAGTAGLALASLGPFALLWPALRAMPVTSRFNLAGPEVSTAGLAPLLVVVAVGALSFAWSRAWLDLAVLGWLTVMLLSLRETYPWDLLTLLSWLVAPVIRRPAERSDGGDERVRQTRLLVLLPVAVLVFGNTLAPAWVSQLL